MDRARLISMSQEEYRALTPGQIAEFIVQNIGQYAHRVIAVLRQIFGQIDYHEICNCIFEIAYPQLLRLHREHPEAQGEERSRLMFSTLRWTALHVVPSQMIRAYGVGHEVRSRLDENLAAVEDVELFGDDEDVVQKRVSWVEWARLYLSPLEYRILRSIVCDGLDSIAAAAVLGTSPGCVFSTRSRIKSKLAALASLEDEKCAAVEQPYIFSSDPTHKRRTYACKA